MGRTPVGRTREKVFKFVRRRLLSGQPPTVREVQKAFGFRAVQTARQHLEQLVGDGRLAVDRNKSRGYRLAESVSGRKTLLVPVLGRVPAGVWQEAIEDPDGYVTAEAPEISGEVFALRVQGESMIGAGILPGDLVLVHRQPTAQSGDIVVALVENEATVKTFKQCDERIELHPSNPLFTPIILDAEAVVMLGKVLEVRRTLS